MVIGFDGNPFPKTLVPMTTIIIVDLIIISMDYLAIQSFHG
jgi:hypothetical protein